MSTTYRIVKVSDKPNVDWDYDSTLKWLRISDKERDWSGVYSQEQFRKFWDIRVNEEYSR
ncbi:MAG: hypothetical protein WBQ16_04240 [Nitrososphaeraceae archaeon]